MKIIDKSQKKIIKRVFIFSLSLSIVIYILNYMLLLSTNLIDEFSKLLSSSDPVSVNKQIALIRESTQNAGLFAAIWIDYLFMTLFSVMIFSGSALIYNSPVSFKKWSKTGNAFALIGILYFISDLIETSILQYMLYTPKLINSLIAVTHVLTLAIATIMATLSILYLILSLFIYWKNVLKREQNVGQ